MKIIIKKIVLILLLIIFLNSCITLKIDKDREPLIDYGFPLIGHYRNGDTTKSILYTVLFFSGIVGLLLFAPTQDNGTKCLLQIDRSISDYFYYSFLVGTACVPIASSIDGALTYHYVNGEIIKLNNIPWNSKSNITKYEAIKKWRLEQEAILIEESNLQRLENYKDEIEKLKRKLIDGTITDDELIFIEKSELIKKSLKNELGFYYTNLRKKAELNQNKYDIEDLRKKLIDATITEEEYKYIMENSVLQELLKDELGYYKISIKKNK